MSSRMRPIALRALLVLASGLAISCQSLPFSSDPPTDVEAFQDASDAYIAYEAGDCETTMRLSAPERLASWEPTETYSSMLLLHAFCKELDGDVDDARDLYDRLIEESPNSFAARDAMERSRILRIQESDPNHAAWMRAARDRAKAARSDPKPRVPVERRPAVFPPVARTTGVEGYAVVEFGVTPRGRTSDPVVIESHPPLIFDGTALRAIRQWEYERRSSASSNDLQVIRLVFVTEDPDAPPDRPAPDGDGAETDAAVSIE